MASKQEREERTKVPSFVVRGGGLSFHDDLYPFLLTLTWSQFFGLFVLLFLFVNLVFAGLYSLFPHCVENANGFVDNFFFSVETLGTIGYGEMTPSGLTAHIIVTSEAFVGIAATAMMTGLIFARFARPTAKIIFTDHMVIGLWNGHPHLMFRMANRRRNQMAEAQVSLMVLLKETTAEGHVVRKPTELSLVRAQKSDVRADVDGDAPHRREQPISRRRRVGRAPRDEGGHLRLPHRLRRDVDADDHRALALCARRYRA